VSEVDEHGLYTGRLVGEPLHGPAKAEAVRALAEREGLDLSRCTAYSDSSNDVPMLSAVGHAVAVNPDTSLRETARANGWEVRDFRTGRKAAKVGVPAAAGVGAPRGRGGGRARPAPPAPGERPPAARAGAARPLRRRSPPATGRGSMGDTGVRPAVASWGGSDGDALAAPP
jgi:hypothetical protein